jgi:hypothetical protein
LIKHLIVKTNYVPLKKEFCVIIDIKQTKFFGTVICCISVDKPPKVTEEK